MGNGRKAILSTTKRCCEALEKAGGNPYSDERNFQVRDAAGNIQKETRKVFNEFTSPRTGVSHKFKPLKNDRALPTVMSRERQKLLAAAGVFFQEREHQSFRYAVATGGSRCRVHEIKTRVREIRGQVSAFSAWAQRAFAQWGFEVLMVAFEITSHCEPTDTHLTNHPHANVIYRLRKRLSSDQWTRFLEGLHARCSNHIKECGRAASPLALLTYAMKLNHIEQVLDHGEYVAFHDQLRRLTTVQFHGKLRDFRKSFERNDYKAQKDPTRLGRYILVAKQKRSRASGPKVWDAIPSQVPLGDIIVREKDGSYSKAPLVMKVVPKLAPATPLKSTYTILLSSFPHSFPVSSFTSTWDRRSQFFHSTDPFTKGACSGLAPQVLNAFLPLLHSDQMLPTGLLAGTAAPQRVANSSGWLRAREERLPSEPTAMRLAVLLGCGTPNRS
jgi:hypothetical protein